MRKIVLALTILSAMPSPAPAAPETTTSLEFPIRAAFYYPWFPQAWSQKGIFPYTRFHPSLGYYTLSDPAVLGQHIAWMQQAKIEAGISSWFGVGHHTDLRVPALLQAADGTPFRWTLYYEMESRGNPSALAIDLDLDYIAAQYATHPSFLHVGGRPVLFVYAGSETCEMIDRWMTANEGRFHVVLKVFSNYRYCPRQPDGWHQYSPGHRTAIQKGYSFGVSPGFWKMGESTPRLSRDVARFRMDVAAQVASKEPWQLITTWNEWGENSAIEPAKEWGSTYVEILAAAGT
jgi:hypothetical protein